MPKSKQPYWEPKLKRNVQRDRQSNRQLRRLGWDVLVVWECETRDLFRLSKRLTEFLSK
jgi:DNA mismatch endonuclease (patch repair protein)